MPETDFNAVLQVPWHHMTPIRRLRIWQVISPNTVTDKKQRIRGNKGAKVRQDESGGGKENLTEKEKRREKTESRLKASEEERLMSVMQRDVFCHQPTLDCQLTELPTQTSLRRSDKRADVVRALGNLRHKGYFPPTLSKATCSILRSQQRLTRCSLTLQTLLNHYSVFYIFWLVSQLPGSPAAAEWCHQVKTQNRRSIIFSAMW